MKNAVLIFLILLTVISCDKFPGVSDYAGVPESSESSKQQGLLIAEYSPSQKTVYIDDEKYFIIDSWSTYRFKTKGSSEINKEMYEFLINLENAKNGKSLTQKIPSSSFLNKSVRNLDKDYGLGLGIGIESGLLSINYLSSKKPISPDTIKIEFKSGNQIQHVSFNKASH